jgi:hypothetical protein
MHQFHASMSGAARADIDLARDADCRVSAVLQQRHQKLSGSKSLHRAGPLSLFVFPSGLANARFH